MSNCRNPLHCIVPGFILKRMAESPNKKVRRFAIDNIGPSAAMRAVRKTLSSMQFFAAIPSPAGRKDRLIYDGGNLPDLPGKLVRSEGDPKHKDVSVNEAYNFSGYTYDFYKKLFDRNSLDNNGMPFAPLEYGEPNAISNAKFYTRLHDIHVRRILPCLFFTRR